MRTRSSFLVLALTSRALASGANAGLAIYIFGFVALVCVALPSLVSAGLCWLLLDRRRVGKGTFLIIWLAGSLGSLACLFLTPLSGIIERIFHKSSELATACVIGYTVVLTAILFLLVARQKRKE